MCSWIASCWSSFEWFFYLTLFPFLLMFFYLQIWSTESSNLHRDDLFTSNKWNPMFTTAAARIIRVRNLFTLLSVPSGPAGPGIPGSGSYDQQFLITLFSKIPTKLPVVFVSNIDSCESPYTNQNRNLVSFWCFYHICDTSKPVGLTDTIFPVNINISFPSCPIKPIQSCFLINHVTGKEVTHSLCLIKTFIFLLFKVEVPDNKRFIKAKVNSMIL